MSISSTASKALLPRHGAEAECALCPWKVYSTETDKFGSYRVIVKEKGKGTITVTIDTTSVSAGMFSYDKATRYDWVLDTKDGELFLRRK